MARVVGSAVVTAGSKIEPCETCQTLVYPVRLTFHAEAERPALWESRGRSEHTPQRCQAHRARGEA